MALVLYSYFRSSCSYRVRIALNIKGCSYTQRPVHLVDRQQHGPEYASINPMNQVPALIDGERVIGESVAIIEYLDALFPQPRLIPEDPFAAAKARQLVEIVNSGIQPLQNLKVLQHVSESLKGDRSDWARLWIGRGLEALEAMAGLFSGTYLVGDSISAADCFLVPQLYNARRFDMNMDRYPILTAIDQRLRAMQAFQEAHPSRQPDTPDDLRHDPL
ncbi:MAG: maleylacetoacetate isomerase [Acidobacteria bacterium]|nr:maleylacetoacetate isomerase [Acidobacteriota bacterium]